MPPSFLRVALAGTLALVLSAETFAQRDLRQIPDPDPELERQTFIVPDEFEVNLFASDPLLAKPIQINFDSQGRLWIASSEIYPHIKPGQEANDKILVLEDRDGDGRADKTTVFADGLLIPTGVIPGDGGAYVANSTELIHLQDTTGDGRADRRRVVLSGFGTEDTHHLLHTLRWGPDGCLYMNQSIYIHSHVETPYGVKRLNGGGVWRFRPETMRLEVFCRGFVNPWGFHFDRWGQSFATDGAYGEGINFVFPGSIFVTAPGEQRFVRGLNPGSPKHCGLEVLSGRHLPPEMDGNMVTNDFRAHRVCRFVVSEDGSGYASRQETELIKSSHVAFRPIDVKMGPDGAIYIADWYNPIIQHGEVDFRDPRRDRVHGRIWRIVAKQRPLVEPVEIDGAPVDQLLDYLKLPEQWVRLHAKLALKSHERGDVLNQLSAWTASLDPNDADYEHQRLEALWAYQTIDAANPALLAVLLTSPDHRVRAAAIRVAADWRDRVPSAVEALKRGVHDEHPRVRLESVRGLAVLNTADAARTALEALDYPLDQFLDFALWQAMRDLREAWLPEVRAGRLDFGEITHWAFALDAVDAPGIVKPLVELIEAGRVPPDRLPGVLSLIARLGEPADQAAILDMLLDRQRPWPPAARAALLDTLTAATTSRKVKPAGDLTRIAPFLESDDAGLRAAAARAVGAWQLEPLRSRLVELAATAPDDDPRVRAAAIESLATLGGSASVELLTTLASTGSDWQPRVTAVRAIARLNPKRAANLAVTLMTTMDASGDPTEMLEPLLAQKAGPPALIESLAGQAIEADVAKRMLAAVRASSQPSPELLDAVQQAGNLQERGWKMTPELLERLLDEVASKGDPARGELVYRREQLQCAKCHAIAGAGGRVGPDLVSIGASAPVDYLIESLLEPDAKIKENFHTLLVQTDAGQVVTGVVVRRTASELVLRDAEDRQVTIPTDEIIDERDGRSLMPDGSVDSLTRDELVDLVCFLSKLGKVGDYAVGQSRVVRRWQTLDWTQEAHRRFNRTSFDTAATDDPALTWVAAYSLVSGDLPIADLAPFVPHRNLDPTSFVRCELEVTTAGRVALQFNSAAGLALWVDGKPVPCDSRVELSLEVGRHRLTIAINQPRREMLPLRLELVEPAESPAQVQIVVGK